MTTMPPDITIECTIHWRADGREGQRDLILRDRLIGQLIPGLIDRLGLQQYTDGPTQSVATLHPGRQAAPFPEDHTLSEVSVRDGDQVWLIVTPTVLPLTVDWDAGERQGQHTVLLPAARPVAEQIRALLNELGLRDLVDGPVKAVATLHPASDAPAWDGAATLLDLDVRANAHIRLHLAPQYMPVVLHWTEDSQKLQKGRYLAVSKTIGEHLADLVGLLGVESQVDGPSRSAPALHTDPTRPALAEEQTLAQAGVGAGDSLWFTLTPTYVTVTVHYPASPAADVQQLTLPCTRPIQDWSSDLVQQLGLPASDSLITLHPAAEARAWPQASTLADHNIRDGDQIWLKLTPAALAPSLRLLLFAAGAGVGLVLLFFLNSAFRGPQLAPTAIVVNPTAPLSTVAPSATAPAAPTLVPPTPTLAAQQAPDYAAGQQALAAQDWLTAIEAFQRVFAGYPDDSQVRELLAMAYYNYAERQLSGPNAAEEALGLVRRTLTYSPTHQLGRALEQRLVLYLEGQAAIGQRDWVAGIATFEQLHALQPDFLNANQWLYDAYMVRAVQLKEQNDIPAARTQCQNATALTGIDTTTAQSCLVELAPKLEVRKTGAYEPSRCIAVQIGGIDVAGWRIRIHGLKLSAGFDAAGVARVCNLPGHAIHFSVLNEQGQTVTGGKAIPAKGRDTFNGVWR